eukprot:CAMPEP_0185582732 /NCGR_PEP_ID=MMETSP0434-20130131/21087_1 /TAXON_ID=626734 ORGANISM="Favella taraikaensis, Strain Fe Narragansett Bay" /NCGR_SAMPLE_ID=MMETSP0434 /ASSEMBLY_ACC=CAM_ASM_000379 /LENGTH=63 /DNA_ID=CAMNT_0028201637 /DNA_START=1598 /DNA_END=1789 /DNA_ORIENTATION=+
MNDVQGPDIFDTLDDLSDDDAGLFLADMASSLKQDSQIVTIRILLHHVDVGASFDRLMQAHGM